MKYQYIAAAALLSISAMSAVAQSPGTDPMTGARPGHVPGVGESLPLSDKASNIVPANTRSNVAPTLPASGLGDNAGTFEYLRVARAALVAGRTGQAQQSLEMAETRALDRWLLQDQINTPSTSVTVGRIRDARLALGNRDTSQAIRLIDLALAG